MSRLAALALLALVGCEARLLLGEPCALSSDCPAPYACLAGRCRTECRELRDCPMPLECLELGGGDRGCRVAQESSCDASSCAAPLVCGAGGCAQPCASDAACAPGLTCATDGCRAPLSFAGAGACDPTAVASGCGAGERCALVGAAFDCAPASGAGVALGATCTDGTCAEGLVCAGGRCVRVCRTAESGCSGAGCGGTSCGEDLYCDPTAIGIAGGDLPPDLPEGLAYCSERCDVYADEATDGCAEETACAIVNPSGAWYFWCRPLTPRLAAYDPCDADFGGCPFGTLCEISADGSGARLCRPFCHPGSSECAGGRPCLLVDDVEVGVCGD